MTWLLLELKPYQTTVGAWPKFHRRASRKFHENNLCLVRHINGINTKYFKGEHDNHSGVQYRL